MSFNEIRVTDNRGGKRTVDVRPFQKGFNPPKVEAEPEPLSDHEVLERNIAKVAKMLALGSYGDRLARELLSEVYNEGYADGKSKSPPGVGSPHGILRR